MSYQLRYREHLSETDLELLAEAAGTDGAALRVVLGERPGSIDQLLADPKLFETVFERPDPDLRVRLTPFLAFGILVNRCARDLKSLTYTFEWSGPNQRLPVFDVDSMRAVLDEGARRYFLIEFLASFTKVASGKVWVRTRRGYRSRRFSELDLVRMADMVEQLPMAQRPTGYRRLGDVALFLTGVFPDHTARHPLPPVHRERLARSAGLDPQTALFATEVDFYEAAGTAWYRMAGETAAALVGRGPAELEFVSANFTPTRRVLNYLADQYLHHYQPGLSRPA